MAAQLDIQKIIADDFFSEPECALHLTITERTLQRMVLEHRAPPVTFIRKKRFFEKSAVFAWEKKRQRPVPQARPAKVRR